MRVIRAFKTINYRLWVAILITNFIPTIYQTVRIYILGDLPSDNGINIASQLQWVNLIYEIFQEALILPLFHLLGKSLYNQEEFSNKVRTGLLITLIIYILVSVIVISCAKPLVKLMAQSTNLIDQTVTYIRLETVAALFLTLWKFMTCVLVTLKKDIYMYIVLLVQMILSIIMDIFLVSNLKCSLKVGVNGIAITNIVVNFIIIIISLFLLRREKISLCDKYNFVWLKEWLKVGSYSGIESFLRNLSFMVMVVRMVNVVNEQGNYWIANSFIWNWMLVPASALGDVVKKEIGEDKQNVSKKTFGYFLFDCVFAILWLISIPAWKPFLRIAMNVNEYETVYYITLIETGFYMTFIFNSYILDSTFYGLGKTNYMLFQSICIDVVYYGVMFILYKTNVFKPTLKRIALMFGCGMLLDFVPTLILYIIMLKKEKIKIDINLLNDEMSFEENYSEGESTDNSNENI